MTDLAKTVVRAAIGSFGGQGGTVLIFDPPIRQAKAKRQAEKFQKRSQAAQNRAIRLANRRAELDARRQRIQRIRAARVRAAEAQQAGANFGIGVGGSTPIGAAQTAFGDAFQNIGFLNQGQAFSEAIAREQTRSNILSGKASEASAEAAAAGQTANTIFSVGSLAFGNAGALAGLGGIFGGGNTTTTTTQGTTQSGGAFTSQVRQ